MTYRCSYCGKKRTECNEEVCCECGMVFVADYSVVDEDYIEFGFNSVDDALESKRYK